MPNKSRRKMVSTCRCDVSTIFHRASNAKHLGSIRHLEIIRQDEIFIPEWLFKEEQTPISEKKY